MRTVLAIAGSDSSGGAGIQADIKTITAHGLYAETAITAVTAQNTCGVDGIIDLPPEFIVGQIRACFDDIPPDAVKIGMVSSAEAVVAIAGELARYAAPAVVLDPVMVATSGAALSDDEALDALVEHLLPHAAVVTPNIPEAEVLAGRPISSLADMEAAARIIKAATSAAVLIKGGHRDDCADDLLIAEDGSVRWLRHRRIPTVGTHGTGCTLSSAIACGLACGLDAQESVAKAKAYVTGAIEHAPGLGHGAGPLDHMWSLR